MAARAVVLRREIFDVNVAARPACRRRLERFEHWVRAATIKMRVLGRRLDRAREVKKLALSLIVEMQMHRLRIEFFQLVEKRHVRAGLARVIDFPGSFES